MTNKIKFRVRLKMNIKMSKGCVHMLFLLSTLWSTRDNSCKSGPSGNFELPNSGTYERPRFALHRWQNDCHDKLIKSRPRQ